MSNRELMINSAIHFGRGMAPYSRLLQRESGGLGSDEVISKLKQQLKTAEEEKKLIIQENQKLVTELKKSINIRSELQRALTATENQRLKLITDVNQLHQKNEKLEHQDAKQLQIIERQLVEITELQNQVKEDGVKIEDRMQQIKLLEGEIETLKQKSTEVSPARQQKIIEEYKASSELIEAVTEEFGKGYRTAKAKMAKAGIDTSKIFSDSEEENEDAE